MIIHSRAISTIVSIPPIGRARRGFTMIEMLSAVVLLSMFLLLSNVLFMATVRISRDAPRARAADVPVDTFRTQLTRDVWNAASLSVTDDQTLSLELPQGSRIRWQYVQHTLTRTVTPAKDHIDAESHRDFHGLAPVHFAVQGSVVRCTLDAPPAPREPTSARAASADSPLLPGRAATFTFQSQILLEAHP